METAFHFARRSETEMVTEMVMVMVTDILRVFQFSHFVRLSETAVHSETVHHHSEMVRHHLEMVRRRSVTVHHSEAARSVAADSNRRAAVAETADLVRRSAAHSAETETTISVLV